MGDYVTNEQKALNMLNQVRDPLCDDCLAEKALFSQRQTANSICRDLDKRGQIKRTKGSCSACGKFKIVNEYLKGISPEVTKTFHKKEKMEQVYRPWYWEGNVQSVLVDWLVAHGFAIRSVADTAARSQGKDIVAIDSDGKELWVTVKGYPEKSSHTQARHWFSDALMSLILYRDENSTVSLALALPDSFVTYLNLATRIDWFRRALPLEIYWISEDMQVRVE